MLKFRATCGEYTYVFTIPDNNQTVGDALDEAADLAWLYFENLQRERFDDGTLAYPDFEMGEITTEFVEVT